MAQLQRKKVLFLITKSNWGGAQRYVYDLATNVPADWEPIVAFGGTGVRGSAAGRLAEMLKGANVRTISLPSLGRDVGIADIAGFLEILRVIRQEHPDVLHLNSSKAAGLGALAGRIAHVPRIVYTAHGWPFWEERAALSVFLIRMLSWLTIALSHSTICISEYDRAHVRSMPLVQRKLAVVRNGIGEIDFHTRADARAALFSKEQRARHAGDVWVITNAELHPNKNLFAAIDAVAAYNKKNERRIFYAIMSDGELRFPLEKHISARGLDESVAMLGFVPEGRGYMRAFDIFLLPSKKEGVPYVILEAGLAGLPVVASNVGGIPEALSGACDAYLVDPKDANDIVRGLARAVSDLASPRTGTKLMNIIRERFSQTVMFKETFSLYERP